MREEVHVRRSVTLQMWKRTIGCLWGGFDEQPAAEVQTDLTEPHAIFEVGKSFSHFRFDVSDKITACFD